MPYGWYSNCATTTNQTLYYPQNHTQYYTLANATSYAVSPNATWQQWVNTSATTLPTYSNEAWYQWTAAPQFTHRAETPEQIRVGQERYEAQCRERRAATARARILLGEFLTDEQKTELEGAGRFHVTGSRGRRYCIRTSGQSGNVDLLSEKGEVQATLCAHPGGYLPDGDAWLTQMLEIRHDEDHFLQVANVHRGRLPAGMR